jgi:tetratricopeptide (TPR) repeat protein
MTSSTSRLIPLLFLSSALALAQTTGGGTTGGGTTGGGSTGGAGRGPSTTTGGTTGTTRGRTIPPIQDQDQQRPIMLNGRVVYDDGTPPSDRVSIERVCNGKARREAYTDSRGYFSITIDDRQPMMMMQDASVGSEGLDPSMRPGGMTSSMIAPDPSGSRNLNGCELRAVLAGSTSNSIQLTGHRAFDDPNVGTLVLRRMTKPGGSTVSLTSLQAPGTARKAFERGKKDEEKQKIDEAKAEFTKAVELYPAYAEAWAELSDIYLKESDFDNARMTSEKALAADSHFVRPYFTLIVLAAGKEDWAGAVKMSDKLLALDSYNYPAGYYYNALANYRLHNLDKAEASLKAARKLDPNVKLPKIGLLMGTILIDRNDFAGAVQELRAFLDHVPEGTDAQYARNALTFAQNRLASAAAPK